MSYQLIALVMLIIHFKSHLCKKWLVCYDYNQFCPLSDVTKNMIKLSKKTSLRTHIYSCECTNGMAERLIKTIKHIITMMSTF